MKPEKLTNTEKVRQALLKNENMPYYLIGEEAKLEWGSASRALRNLRSQGVNVPRPTKEEQYKRVGDALRGRVRADLSEVQTSTWRVVYPLALRNASNIEIVEITGLSYVAVKSLVSNKRGYMEVPEYKSSENRAERRIRTNLRISAAKRGMPKSPHEINSLSFARMAFMEGLIDSEGSAWHQLKELYRSEGRELPQNFYDRLRLEVFLKARLALSGEYGQSVLATYFELGRKIDDIWFGRSLQDHEDFTAENIDTLYDGEDEKGFYRVGKDGEKWRRPAESDDNGIVIYDNSKLARRRRQIRGEASKD